MPEENEPCSVTFTFACKEWRDEFLKSIQENRICVLRYEGDLETTEYFEVEPEDY